MSEPVRYSVVVPVYRNRDSLPDLVDRLVALNERARGRLEGVFVVDGSPDDSIDVLRSVLAGRDLDAQVLTHSRNFGSFAAIRSGLAAARGEYIGVMAADLQEPAEVVAAFFDALEADECDIALGERIGRDDPSLASAASVAYWRLYRRFINRDIPNGGVDVFGVTRRIADLIVSFPETHTSLIGLLYWMGYRRKHVAYWRQARHSGQSGWTVGRKLRYLFDSIYSFTDLPIILLQLIGFLGFVASLLIGVVVLAAWMLGRVQQPGYTPVMILIAGATSALLLGLGVVGSYVWRGYENSKRRPQGLVATHEYYEP